MGLHQVYASPTMICLYEDKLEDFAAIAMSPRILAICLEIATEQALPIAIEISPRGDTGSYVRSWKVEPTTVVLRGMRRVGARLINTSPHAGLIEWGGKPGGGRYKGRYRPAQHILQQVRDRLTNAGAFRNAADPDLAEGLFT